MTFFHGGCRRPAALPFPGALGRLLPPSSSRPCGRLVRLELDPVVGLWINAPRLRLTSKNLLQNVVLRWPRVLPAPAGRGTARDDAPGSGAGTWRAKLDRSSAVLIALVVATLAGSSSVAAQTARVERACTVGGDTVVVQVQEVPDLQQRCYEVVYGTQKGYLCVWAGGTPDGMYGYTRRFDAQNVTEQGWTGGGNLGCTADDCFNALCAWLVRDHRLEQARMKFDPQAAAEELDEFFKAEQPRATQR